MQIERRIGTDTATLVLFDHMNLESRINDECDWWTGDGDLEAEERRGNLISVETGQDGLFDLMVRDGDPDPGWQKMKSVNINVPSGRIFFGAAEYLPGEGAVSYEQLVEVFVKQGCYTGVVYAMKPHAYCICLKPMVFDSPVKHRNEICGIGSGQRSMCRDVIAVSPAELISLLNQSEGEGLVQTFITRIDSWARLADGKDVLLESPSHGLELVFNDGCLMYIHLHSEEVDRRSKKTFSQYPFPLPHDLRFGMPKGEASERLGKPFKGTGTSWAIYRTETYGIRVGYVDEKLFSLNLLSLASSIMS